LPFRTVSQPGLADIGRNRMSWCRSPRRDRSEANNQEEELSAGPRDPRDLRAYFQDWAAELANRCTPVTDHGIPQVLMRVRKGRYDSCCRPLSFLDPVREEIGADLAEQGH